MRRRPAALHGARPRVLQFIRFCVVGGVGFLVDAGVLVFALHILGAGPILGRLLSFSAAVVATFILNRQWAFRRRGAGALAEFRRYLGVQGVGFACNFAVYTLLALVLPPPLNAPLICLAIASAAALLVNYAGASALVFRPASGVVSRNSDGSA